MTYTWHSITKNIHAENLGLKFNRRLDKIKKQLLHFSENSVHLNIALEKNPKKEIYVASLTLHLPSNILHTEKSADKLMTAFDHAADALVREIASLKSDLRGEFQWKRRSRRMLLHQAKLTRFGVLPMGEDASETPAIAGEMLEEHRGHLLSFVHRQISRDEAGRRIPVDLIEPKAVVEDVIRLALATVDEKPLEQTHKVWFYVLAREELKRRYSALNVLDREGSEADGRAERAELLHRKFEPPFSEPLEAYIDSSRPDLQAQLLEQFQLESEGWTEDERAVFDLRFFEGLGPDEIATITGQGLEKVCETIDSTGQRMRELKDRLVEPELVGA